MRWITSPEATAHGPITSAQANSRFDPLMLDGAPTSTVSPAETAMLAPALLAEWPPLAMAQVKLVAAWLRRTVNVVLALGATEA
jgi:hypothetical protein